MLNTTKAIVLHKINYSDTSLVVQVFTQQYGKVGLLIQGAKKRKAKIKTALFEPLSVLELVANFSDLDKLIRPREVKLHIPFISIQSNISKRSVVLFLSEILHKCIREPHPDQAMFHFVEKSLYSLEQSDSNTANFHLAFLLELSKHLGFHPQKSNGEYFDMVEGVFSNSVPNTNLYLQGEEKDLFLQVLGTKIEECSQLTISSEQRKTVLSALIRYYQTHVSGLGEVKSHTILESVFN